LNKLRVAVLMGGTSAERAISLSTGRQIMAALAPDRYLPMALDAAALSQRAGGWWALSGSGKTPSLPPGVPDLALPGIAPDAEPPTDLAPIGIAQMAAGEKGARPDVVFIALHGKGGEDGSIQGMLELLGIPYTGSGVLASALAMDKAMSKRLFRAEGIPVPDDIVVQHRDRPDAATLHARLSESFGYPVIIKPNAEGSTIGCAIVRRPDELDAALDIAFRYDSTVLVEQYLSGTEITAGLLGSKEPEVLPLIEIIAKGGFYDYEAKYAPGGSEHIIPARIPEIAAQRARDYAVRCHLLLGCQGMSRVDMMVVDEQPYVLEVNTIPGMTPTSLLPEAARAAGIDFPTLLDRLIEYALQDRASPA